MGRWRCVEFWDFFCIFDLSLWYLDVVLNCFVIERRVIGVFNSFLPVSSGKISRFFCQRDFFLPRVLRMIFMVKIIVIDE